MTIHIQNCRMRLINLHSRQNGSDHCQGSLGRRIVSLNAKKSVRALIIPFRGFPWRRNFSGWTSVKSPKMSVIESCEVAMRWSYI